MRIPDFLTTFTQEAQKEIHSKGKRMGHNYGCIAHGLTSAHRGALSDGTNATSCVHKSPSAEVNPQQGQMYGSQLRLLLVWLHIMASSAAPPIVLAVPTVRHYGLRERNL